MEAIARHHTRKMGIGKWEWQDVPHVPGNIGEILFLLPFPRFLNHGWREIKTCHMSGMFGQFAGHNAGTTSHIKNRFPGTHPTELNQHIHRFGMAGKLREWDGL